MDAAGATADQAERAGAPLLVEAREQALLIAALRLGLAVAALAAAVVRGVDSGAAFALLALGAFALLLAVYGGDRRTRSALKFEEALPRPEGARVVGRARSLGHAAYPSTIGLAALTVVALALQPGLAALLAGLLGGLGVMSLVGLARLASWEARRGTRFFVEPRTDAVYEAPR